MTTHKKPQRRGMAPGSLSGLSISVRNSNRLITAAAVFLFAALGAAMGQAVDGMGADLASGPVDALLVKMPCGNQVSTRLGGRADGR